MILTQPLGSGILNTAIKAEMASAEETESVQRVMAKLNKYAAEIAGKYTIHSCTDVTGFSLAGHSLEMAKGSGKTLVIHSGNFLLWMVWLNMPRWDWFLRVHIETREFAGEAIRSEIRELWKEDVVFDPQTSGGLLLAVPSDEADQLAAELGKMDISGGLSVLLQNCRINM